MALNRTQKRCLFTVWELKQEVRALLVWPSLGKCIRWLNFFTTLYRSVNGPENATSIDFGFQEKFYQVGEFANMESANNEDQLKLWNK